jgi:hypothetical protein
MPKASSYPNEHLELEPIAFGFNEIGKLTKPPVGINAIRRAVRSGLLPAHEVANRKFIFRDDFVAFIKRGRPSNG